MQCVLETQWCSLVLLILELVWTVSNSVDHVHSFHSINNVKTIVTMQFFKLELVNVTRLDNKTSVYSYCTQCATYMYM